VPAFLTEIQAKNQNGTSTSVDSNEEKTNATAAEEKKQLSAAAAVEEQPTTAVCRLCQLSGECHEVMTSHRTADLECPQLSAADRRHISSQRQQDRQFNGHLDSPERKHKKVRYGHRI
jgi:hypothetical protein